MADHPTHPIVTKTPHPPGEPAVPLPAAPVVPDAAPDLGGTADSRNAPALPLRNRKDPRVFSAPSQQQITSAPPLLLGVSNLPFFTNQKLETNSFVPSSIVMFAILSELDTNMANTYRYLQSAPNWIPLVSQLYMSILFFVHVFNVSAEAGLIDQEQFQFLQWFKSTYDFRSLLIPGPLVPVFQALTHCSGPFDWIGNIAPNLPEAVKPAQNDAYSCQRLTIRILPHVPLIVDQIQWFLNVFNITTDNENNISECFYSNLFGTNAALGSFGLQTMYSPNAQYNVPVSSTQYKAFKAQSRSFNFPTRLGSNPQPSRMTWNEYLRFSDPLTYTNRSSTWFTPVSSVMQRYCQFVRGSVPLSAISPTGLGAGIPIWTYQLKESFPDPNIVKEKSHIDAGNNVRVVAPTHFALPARSTLSSIGDHFDPELETLAEQFSAATQVNVSFSKLGAHEDPEKRSYPADANLRQGQVWTLPVVRTSPTTDVVPTHGPIVMAHYHNDTRMV